mmetsp:Transcript_87962/g.249192  ORF Transcript_87962/g.249192 Transcript_87962/m.249192 type:complete len:536 (-) Transcript_87962:127-1734(-)
MPLHASNALFLALLLGRWPAYASSEELDVAVIGGGVSGLVSAFYLTRSGYRVAIYEKAPFFGGQAVGFIDNATGLPVEHSHRVYRDNIVYAELFEMLEEVPSLGGRPAKRLLKASKAQYVCHPLGSPKEVGGLTFFGLPCGCKTGEIMQLGKIITKYLSSKAEHEEATKVSYLDYITKRGTFSERCIGIQAALFGIVVSARMWSTAALIMTSFFGRGMKDIFNEVAFPSPHLQSMEPTSVAWIEPTVRYLVGKGVKVYPGHELIEMEGIASHYAQRAHFKKAGTSETVQVSAKAFIVALPPRTAHRILPSITRGIGAGFNLEWSQGFHFLMQDEDLGPLLALREDSGPVGVGDSPYELVYWVLRQPGWGRTMRLAGGAKAYLTLTASNFHKPGLRFNKTALECTPQELFTELLLQVGISESNLPPGRFEALVKNGIMGYGLDYIDADTEAHPDALMGPRHPQTGKRWSLATPLFIETPTCPLLRTETPVPNLFFAGAHLHLRYLIPTMGKAAKSGRIAAVAASSYLSMGSVEQII